MSVDRVMVGAQHFVRITPVVSPAHVTRGIRYTQMGANVWVCLIVLILKRIKLLHYLAHYTCVITDTISIDTKSSQLGHMLDVQ